MIFKQLKNLLAEQFGVDADTITMDTTFEEDLGADSLDLVDMSMALEEVFGVEEMSEEDIAGITTVGDLVHFLQGRLDG
ncbi:MAG: acyl carrier protein [Oscillospiraceae bacterium]|nr:acyl carrier protein [Oscillospiraceae bacterium]